MTKLRNSIVEQNKKGQNLFRTFVESCKLTDLIGLCIQFLCRYIEYRMPLMRVLMDDV